VTDKKPVLVIKSGRSPAGERAARSHTGSLAQSGRDQLYDALFEQSGVIRAETIGDLFRMAKVFSAGMHLAGPRLAILTNSGGPGIVAADAAIRHGLELPLPTPAAQSMLAGRLPSIAAISNPLDMTAEVGPDVIRETLRTLLANPEVDGGLVIATPAGHMTGEAVAQAILDVKATSGKPIVACLFGLTDLSREVRFLEGRGVPTFTFPEEAVQGLGSLARYQAWRTRPRTSVHSFAVDREKVRSILEEVRRSGALVLPEYSARSLIEAYGISFPAVAEVASLDEAVTAA